ncbi:MAG TPA: hypothetical protein VHV75_09950 [Solirubrobacteraceae bacterium]|jgi:hypothetical protein|nr:hypothetical protein [Solirubrobacteraceae bacterium]
MKRTKLERHTVLKTDPEKRQEFQRRGAANSKHKRRPISPASPEQRQFVRGKFCLECGTAPADPCHIIDRSLLGEGQDDTRAVFPLCRTHHDAYDSRSLDALPLLEQDGWREHLAFAVGRFGLVRTLERVTGERWRTASYRLTAEDWAA